MSNPPAVPAADTAIAISRTGTTPSGGKSEDLRPSFDGNARELGPIAWRNALLNLITLGLYRFWGKTRVRRYLWSRISLGDECLEYTGTGKELFFGFLVALVIFIPLAAFGTAIGMLGVNEVTAMMLNALYLPLILLLIGLATYRARRYRLTRTLWRGIRCNQTGAAWRYALKYLGFTLLLIPTLGLTLPVMNIALQRQALGNTWYGSLRSRFEGRARDLFKTWLMCWLLLIPTLGASYAWYKAAEFRYLAAQTSFGEVRFRSALGGRRIFVIYLVYWLVLLVVSGAVFGVVTALVMLNIAMPNAGTAGQQSTAIIAVFTIYTLFGLIALAVSGALRLLMVTQPILRAASENLAIIGEPDWAAIAQNTDARPRRGEGLADALDLGDF